MMLALLAFAVTPAICAAENDDTPSASAIGDNAADPGEDVSDDAKGTDEIAQDDDMIDLRLTTTLIIIFCSVFGAAIVVMVVILGRKNSRGPVKTP